MAGSYSMSTFSASTRSLHDTPVKKRANIKPLQPTLPSTNTITTTTTTTKTTPCSPRPDSSTLPFGLLLSLTSPRSRQMPRARVAASLDRTKFHAIVHHPAVGSVQYWLTVGAILDGTPGPEHVPRGHWEKLVRLARAVVSEQGAGGMAARIW
ncbi:hypothetical protein PT974_11344 [Cladobotryum mycophilum]|uniref:Uncharacterized protein n=1 Tax=Cladobotryum mycophilum TaxID=491253 RepID=A0ABR0S4Y8_9HYPO